MSDTAFVCPGCGGGLAEHETGVGGTLTCPPGRRRIAELESALAAEREAHAETRKLMDPAVVVAAQALARNADAHPAGCCTTCVEGLASERAAREMAAENYDVVRGNLEQALADSDALVGELRTVLERESVALLVPHDRGCIEHPECVCGATAKQRAADALRSAIAYTPGQAGALHSALLVFVAAWDAHAAAVPTFASPTCGAPTWRNLIAARETLRARGI